MGKCSSCRFSRAINSSDSICRKTVIGKEVVGTRVVSRQSTCGEYRDGLEYYRKRRREMNR